MPCCQKASHFAAPNPRWINEQVSIYKDKGAGQSGLHKLVVRADNVSIRKEKKEQTGSLFAANALGELIRETRRKLQSVENEVADVWKWRNILLTTTDSPGFSCSAQGSHEARR